MTTLIYDTGFEFGVATLTTNGGGIADAVSGTLSIQSTTKRSGSYALKINPSAAAGYWRKTIASSSVIVCRFYINYTTFPSSNIALVRFGLASGGPWYIYIDSSKVLHAYYSGAANVTGATLSNTGQWYRIEVKLDVSGATHKFDWRVDGTDQSQATQAASATTCNSIGHGDSATGTYEAYFDDLAVSATSGDYPIGVGAVEGLVPTSDGTHNAGTNVMEDASGNDINGSSVYAYAQVDEVPMSESTTYVKQSATGTSNYVEVNFADTSNSTIQGVTAILAYKSAGTSANEGATTIIGDTTDTLYGDPTTRADYSESSVFYKSIIVTPPGGGWTQAKVNALKSRMGYSNDVSPVPYWCNLMIEVAYGPSGTAYTQDVSGGMTPGGEIVKQGNKVATGGVTPSGLLARMAKKILSGGNTPGGVLSKQAQRSVAGGVTPGGVLAGIKIVMKTLTGGLSSAGALAKQVNKTFTGGMTSAGGLAKRLARSLAGGVTPGGALAAAKMVMAVLAGTLGSGGTLAKQVNRTLTGGMSSAGGLIKRLSRSLAGGVTPGGVLGTVKTFLQSVAGSMAPAGALAKRAGKMMTGGLPSVGDLIRSVRKSLSGSVAFAGVESGIRAVGVVLTGAVGFAGNLVRSTGKVLSGSSGFAGGLTRMIAKALTGLLSFVGTLVSSTQINRVTVKVGARSSRVAVMEADGDLKAHARSSRFEVMDGHFEPLEVEE